jgi:hypothetical protein
MKNNYFKLLVTGLLISLGILVQVRMLIHEVAQIPSDISLWSVGGKLISVPQSIKDDVYIFDMPDKLSLLNYLLLIQIGIILFGIFKITIQNKKVNHSKIGGKK